MSEESSLPSLYNLTYSDEESTSKPPTMPFFSPINYNSNTLGTQEGMPSMWDLNAYDSSYLLGTPDSTQPLPALVKQDNAASHDVKRDMPIYDVTTDHLGPPWFCWKEGGGYPA